MPVIRTKSIEASVIFGQVLPKSVFLCLFAQNERSNGVWVSCGVVSKWKNSIIATDINQFFHGASLALTFLKVYTFHTIFHSIHIFIRNLFAVQKFSYFQN